MKTNDYHFWDKYLKNIKKQLINLCCIKNNIYVDLHIHSNYSADSNQSIKEIIKNANEKKFDVIAITDHDTLDAYEEIYDAINENIKMPIIVPGVEITIDNKEYGSQCHILQLFVNPKDDKLLLDIDTNYAASFNRSKIQFKRLRENKAVMKICEKNNISFLFKDYIKYLKENNQLPEYNTIANYMMDKMKKSDITTFELLNLLEKYNIEDEDSERKKLKQIRFSKIRNRYNSVDDCYNSRCLLSMLAIKEVDEDYFNCSSSGSLSVNSYGQLRVDSLLNDYPIIFAHPTESKLQIVENIINNNKKIIGIEKNIRNDYNDIVKFKKIREKYNLCITIGSDSHENNNKLYKEMEFYKMNVSDFKELLERLL